MVLAEARIYTSSPVQSAFHYLNQALHSAGFDESELNRSKRSDEVSLVIWRPSALAASHPEAQALDSDGLYACGIQGSFTRQSKKKNTKKTTTFAWELRLDYEPPRDGRDNTTRLYRVDLQCLLREDGKRRPTENLCFHYNNDARPAKWDVVRNWIRFVLDLRALNPPAWAAPKSRLDVGEVVIDSIQRKSADWSSPPTSPGKQPSVAVAMVEPEVEGEMKLLARHVWSEWALPNLSRHYLCDAARAVTATTKDKGGNQAEDSGFSGCDGNVNWDAAGRRHDGLRASLDRRNSRMSVETRSSSSTGWSSETRTLREGQGRYRLGDVDEDLYEDHDGAWD